MSNTDTITLPHPPDPDANKAILDLEMKISEKLGLRVLSLSQCYHNVMLITKVADDLAWIGPPLCGAGRENFSLGLWTSKAC